MRRDATSNAALDEAAEWLVRLECGLDEAEEAAFTQWIEEDPSRAELLAKLADTFAAVRAPPPNRRLGRRALLAAGFGAPLAIAAGGALWVWRSAPQELATGAGQVRAFALSDGGALWLDAASAASLRLSRTERRLALHAGRALIDIAAGSNPFELALGDLVATSPKALIEATAFARYRRVAVLEGEASLERQGRRERLSAGDAIRVDQTGALSRTRVDRAEPAPWRNLRLRFLNVPLAEAVEELNRYRATPILLAEPRLGATPISGLFVVDAAQERVTPALLAEALGLDVETDAAGVKLAARR